VGQGGSNPAGEPGGAAQIRQKRATVVEFSDEELCSRVAQHDREAFDLLVRRYEPRAYRLAYSMLGNEADARDVSQEVFIRVYETAHQFSGRSRFNTWFHRVLVNLCIDHRRRGKWWQKIVPLWHSEDDPDAFSVEPESNDPGPEAEAIGHQEVARLKRLCSGFHPSNEQPSCCRHRKDVPARKSPRCLIVPITPHVYIFIVRWLNYVKS
jgi:RNA polymerase sigma-70 factor, ECF subfamily